ncbi:hypothetical protein C1H76_6917 [Elsinoe australis]|uniref:Uncharacterized protein n=1 Tax=Elsinoe australis TaxID=40998 RepID=A0A4U7AW77_9PEZI|nr:hypothetical protein C1H76_6917 [Elsinoe australis]
MARSDEIGQKIDDLVGDCRTIERDIKQKQQRLVDIESAIGGSAGGDIDRLEEMHAAIEREIDDSYDNLRKAKDELIELHKEFAEAREEEGQ